MVSIPATKQKNNLLLVSETTFPKIEIHDSQEMVSPKELENAYQKIAQLEARVEEQDKVISNLNQRNRQLKRQLDWRDELDRVPAKIMSQNQKAALYRTVIETHSKEPDSDGWILIKDTDDIAKKTGMATKTLQKCLTHCNSIGGLRKKLEQVRDEDTKQVVATNTYIKQTERTPYPRMFEAEKDRNHGGERIYCRCGSCRIKKDTKVTYTCMDCGVVYDKKPEFLPPLPPDDPEDQIGLTAYEHEIEDYDLETTVIESAHDPEDQIGLTASHKSNLTQLSNNYPEDQVGLTAKDDSNNPPCASSATILQEWLSKRRGTPRIIWATGSTQSSDKYLSKKEDYQPDIEAFIAGKIDHIYGSWLRSADGKTFVLCFEIDQPEHNDQAQDYMLSLARAGAAPVYWQRQRQRGHLEIYFDRPVDPEVARLWALEICPELEDIPECYPCLDKKNNALSWPLYQRIGNEVFPCTAYVLLPAPHAAGIQEVDPTDLEKLPQLVTDAVTPAALIEEFSIVLNERGKIQPREKDKSERAGGVIGINPSVITQAGSDRDLAKQVIANFNRSNRIENMVEVNKRGKFPAAWRGERTPSVALDRSGEYATDYGRNGSHPKKLDAYEVYCLVNNIDKRADLAERCSVLRQKLESTHDKANRSFVAADPLQSKDTTELFSIEKPRGPVYALCVKCGTPKTVWDPERQALTCGSH